MSEHRKTSSDADKELLDLYRKADPETQEAFIAAIKGEKLNVADIMAKVSDIMSDPNVAALFESMKKLFGSGKKANSEIMQQLLAFTIFYSSSIYALLLCFMYWNRLNEQKTEQPEEPDDPDE